MESYACFSNLRKMNVHLISLIWFPKSYQHGLPETITTSLLLMLNMYTYEIIFFHPLCNQGRHIETAIHSFLHCSNYWNQRKTLSNKISNIKSFYRTKIMQLMLNHSSLDRMVSLVNEPTIKYIITTERFIAPVLWVPLLRSPLFLKSLIDSGSPYFIFFSYLVVEFFLYIYFCMPWIFILRKIALQW